MNVSAISIVKSHIVFFFIVSFGVCAKKQYVVMSVAHIAVRWRSEAMSVGTVVCLVGQMPVAEKRVSPMAYIFLTNGMDNCFIVPAGRLF